MMDGGRGAWAEPEGIMKRRRAERGWTKWLLPAGAYAGWRVYRALRTTDLRGRVVLITGGSRGLGLELARQFAREGCRVALFARDEQELERARADVDRFGEVASFRCDVADRERVEEAIQEVVDHFGRLDVLVNNAGIVQVGPFDSMTLGDFERAMAVNFWGPLHMTWSALPHMRQRGGGRVVNITSIGGEVAVPHLLPYSCAKAAFLSLSEGLYAELARHGIEVTTIVPGLMRTGSPVNASFKGDAEREFQWFSASDQHALTSTSAERAARRIVTAVRRHEGKVVLTWQAKMLRLAHSLAPNVVMRVLSTVNGLLPAERGLRFEARRGQELATAGDASSVRRRLEETARRMNQYGETPAPGTGTT
jgi:NAD(P)-dependent dehydrogenase (short-subunit alcohol dehydrogenase family)